MKKRPAHRVPHRSGTSDKLRRVTALFRSDVVDKNTYDVSAGGAEGVRPAHVQMSAVHAQQNLYVVKAVRLQWRQDDQQKHHHGASTVFMLFT